MNKYFTKKNALYLFIALYQGMGSETVIGFIISVGLVLGFFYIWEIYISKFFTKFFEKTRLSFSKTKLLQDHQKAVQIALFVIVMGIFVFFSIR